MARSDRRATAALRPYFSEFALIKYRVHIELRWLAAMSQHPGIPEVPTFSAATCKWLESLVENLEPSDAIAVKKIERTTNHDVKVDAPAETLDPAVRTRAMRFPIPKLESCC